MGFKDKFKNVFWAGEKKKGGTDNREDHMGEDAQSSDSQENYSTGKPAPTGKTKNFKYLDDLIHSGDKEIILDSDIKLGRFEARNFIEGISIGTDGVVIDGNGHVIDANHKSAIFNIGCGDVTIKNLTFKRGFINDRWADGAAIKNKGNLTLFNCNFIENVVYGKMSSGGAIKSSSGILNISYCNFEGNKSIFGNGGAIAISGVDFYMDNSIFKANFSSNGGGALDLCEKVADIKNCTFEGNVSDWGGAINNNECYSICDGSDFIDNYANEGCDISNESKLELYNCNFNHHLDKYKEYHEEKYFDSIRKREVVLILISQNLKNSASSSMEYCNFSMDFHKLLSWESNSQILRILTGSCSVKYSDFTASDDVYCLVNRGVVELKELNFGCLEEKIIINDNVLKIKKDDGLEDKIKSYKNSSIIYFDDGNLDDYKGFEYLDEVIQSGSVEILLDHDIIMHDLEQKFYEGGIDLCRDNLILNGQNHTIDASNLSRIFLITGNNITLKNITFKNGKYISGYFDDDYLCGGGAIYIMKNASLKIFDCKFIHNVSEISGGAIRNCGQDVKISNSFFKNNKSSYIDDEGLFDNNGNPFMAGAHGGAILNEGDVIHLNLCQFEGNDAHRFGGAICNKTVSNIFDCTFKRNKSEFYGSAVYNESKAIINLYNCSFIENHGWDAAIYNKGSFANSSGCTFKDNASGYVYAVSNTGFFTFSSSIFSDRNSKMIINYGVIEIESCDFETHHEIFNKGDINYLENDEKIKDVINTPVKKPLDYTDYEDRIKSIINDFSTDEDVLTEVVKSHVSNERDLEVRAAALVRLLSLKGITSNPVKISKFLLFDVGMDNGEMSDILKFIAKNRNNLMDKGVIED